ncbi:MAG: hypothetical protein GYA17_19410 [Chloroflexi bacterium]|jgi:chemotaxis protein CheC|nr:chemotaxis protein CheC [Anaerolineaceae bacterium]NMB90537.1 hypothetical protein [Chloroflexota bacterium]
MSNQTSDVFSEKLLLALKQLANEGMHNAARGFSNMIGTCLSVVEPEIEVVPLTEIPNIFGGPESEAAGIYLRAEGDIWGQIMLVIPLDKAFELVDLLLENPPGTTTNMGSLERSALAEVGNLTATYFLNRVATITGTSIRPTPPAVMVDMVGAILDIIAATTGGLGENVLMMHTNFDCNDHQVQTKFWVIPDPGAFKKIMKD